MAICKKRAARKAERKAAKAAKKQAKKGSFLGRCLRKLLICTVLVGGAVAAVAYLGRPGTGDGEGA
ncbi:hypothetical protein [Propionibacterium australiense]|uniref:Uncharacterized protein n=1 Tax=Propionibacterium australiense TaxID=119981 RepID=A0A383S7G1_9ACTN|nr:hypothetical protein [Propionibacterium australiense]RLP10959.1 hypothetical protein D9T14_04235 [Propionibacterium australiense]RLP13074.1 hypothetical protein D7U36_01220 [Propionibacterium australiense]SYZ33918.1 Hypothetical protein PROPAUS_1874 [Propionibacterium australiense]VEH90939.1 Uncharacterised protein [Propionibacterium australiense]